MDKKTLQDELVEIRAWARNAPGEMNLAAQITAIWQALLLLADRIDR